MVVAEVGVMYINRYGTTLYILIFNIKGIIKKGESKYFQSRGNSEIDFSHIYDRIILVCIKFI